MPLTPSLKNFRKSEDLRGILRKRKEHKTMNLRVEEELRFNDAAHIKNHLNYLFRCDNAQRWTNVITKGNFAIYSEYENDKGKISFFNKTLNELSAQAQLIKEKIGQIKDFLKYGRMLRVELIDKRDRFNEADVEFGRMLYEAMAVAAEITPICVVGHQDQTDNYLHWHMVYVNKTGEDFGVSLSSGTAKH